MYKFVWFWLVQVRFLESSRKIENPPIEIEGPFSYHR
jgi:hypothetical protein